MKIPEFLQVQLPQEGCNACVVKGIPKVCLNLKGPIGRKQYDYTATLPGHPKKSYALMPIEHCAIRPEMLELQREFELQQQEEKDHERAAVRYQGVVFESIEQEGE